MSLIYFVETILCSNSTFHFTNITESVSHTTVFEKYLIVGTVVGS